MVQKYIFSWYYEHEFKFYTLTQQLHLADGLFIVSGFRFQVSINLEV